MANLIQLVERALDLSLPPKLDRISLESHLLHQFVKTTQMTFTSMSTIVGWGYSTSSPQTRPKAPSTILERQGKPSHGATEARSTRRRWPEQSQKVPGQNHRHGATRGEKKADKAPNVASGEEYQQSGSSYSRCQKTMLPCTTRRTNMQSTLWRTNGSQPLITSQPLSRVAHGTPFLSRGVPNGRREERPRDNGETLPTTKGKSFADSTTRKEEGRELPNLGDDEEHTIIAPRSHETFFDLTGG